MANTVDWSQFTPVDKAPAQQEGTDWSQFTPINDPGFVSTMKRTAGQMAESTAISAEDVFGKNKITDGIQKWGSGVVAENPAGINSLGDIVDNPLLTLKEGIGNMAAQMPVTLAAGAGGQVIGGVLGGMVAGPPGAAVGSFLGRWGGAALPTLAQEYGGIRKEQNEQGIDDKPRALAAGLGATALEFNPLSPEVGMLKLMGGEAGKQLFGQGGKQIAKDLAKAAGKGFVGEGPLEEGPQTLVEAWGAHKDPLSAPVLEEAAVGSILGGIGGGAMGPITATMSGMKYAAAQQEKADAERIAAKEREANPPIAGLLPAPTYNGTPSDQILQAEVARQNEVDAAQKNADQIYAERAAYEKAMQELFPYGQPTVTADIVPLQQHIDELLGIDQKKMTGIQKIHYEQALKKAFDEPIGITHDANGREIPLTMGVLLDSQATAEQAAVRHAAIGNAGQQANARSQQLTDEENPMAAMAPQSIPVVGPLSAAANQAVQTGIAAQVQGQQALAQAAEQAAKAKPAKGGEKPAAQQPITNPMANAAEVVAPNITPVAPNIVTQAPNIEGTPNAAQPAQVAQKAPQTNDAQDAPQPGAAQGQAIDLSGRTDAQLDYLTKHGINGNKEAAVAEVSRRKAIAAPQATLNSETVPAQNTANSANAAQNEYEDAKAAWQTSHTESNRTRLQAAKAEIEQDAEATEVNVDDDDNAPTYGGKYDRVFKGKVPAGWWLAGKNTDGKNIYQAGGARIVEDGDYFVQELPHKPKESRYAEFKTKDEIDKEFAAPAATKGSQSTDVDAAANEAATSDKNNTPAPTEAQQEAGNYKKGHVAIQGLNITIENPQGSKRSGTDEDGKAWETTMAAHYGYIKRTEGNDGDHVDVYVGPNPDSDRVFIVDQSNADGSFDEHKVLLGFSQAILAKSAYAKSYEPGWWKSRVIASTELTVSELKDWLKNGDMSKPYSAQKADQNPIKNEKPDAATVPDETKAPDSEPIKKSVTVDAELPPNFDADLQYAKNPDGSYKTKGEYTSEEWRAYMKTVLDKKLSQPKPDAAPKTKQDQAPAINGEDATTPSTFESFKGRLVVFGKVMNWHGASFEMKQRPNGAYLVEATYPDFNTVYGDNSLNFSKGEAAADAASRAFEWWKAEQSKSAAPKAPATPDAKAVAKQTKAIERDLHVTTLADAGLRELAGTADLEAFTKGAEKAVISRIEELKKDAATPESKAALDALVVDGKPVLPKVFFESAFNSAKKSWENAQKEAARDPELYKETLSWGLGAAKIEEGSDDATKYKAGFDHALRGQTKSTLPNDSDTYLKGYNDARAWVKTENGRAWFDGKRIEKQKNTGVVLKRWWERVKKDIAALTDTGSKAWESMLKSTARSDLFPMTVIAEDATPGAKEIVEKLRANIATFQEFFWWEGAGQVGWKTGRYSSSPSHLFSGDYSGYKGRISGQVSENDDLRLSVSKDIAGEYQEKMKAFVEEFDGVKSLDDIQAVVDRLFYPEGRNNKQGKLKDWKKSDYYNQNGGLFVPNASKISELLPLFANDAWDAKYKSWTRAKQSEDIERAGRGDRKDSLLRPRLDKIIRSGLPNERGQRNISSAEFKKAFGFADVVIGQYVTGQQAQDHLNYAYDALMTMAGLLGAKPNQLSFGGKLYFTVGALGHGKYAAHFSQNHPVEINGKETTVPVINVTATRGDGSVLHEFFHAIDFLTTDAALKKVIAGIKRLLVKEPGDPESVVSTAEQFLSGSRYMTWGGRKGKGDPKDHALSALTDYLGRDGKRSNTSFYTEAQALDKGSTKPYWSNDAEPFARMAEAWGLDTLTNSEKRDDYLVSDWVSDGKVKRPQYRGAPYPMANERKRLVDLFKRFAESIQWTNEGPVLKADSAWQSLDPWKESNKPFLDALKSAADNIDAIDAQRKEREAQKKVDYEKAKLAAIFGEEKAPEPDAPPVSGEAPESDNVGMSDDELGAIFDEEADKLREETQEQPKAESPGEKVTTPKERWTQEDLQFVLDKLNAGELVLVADGGDLGIPSIHDMPNGKHMGMGVFSASGMGWEATFTAGGAMYSTPGGQSYTTLSASKGAVPAAVYDVEAIKSKLKGKLLAKSGPRSAPKLSEEQDKTAAALAKEMAKHGVTGIDEALKGLVAIFGGGNGKLQSFPGGFDEDSYKAAKPHFMAAAEAFGKAGMAFKDFVRVFFRQLITQFGDGVKPYAIRFAKDYEAEFLAKQQETPENKDAPATEYVTESASRKVAEWVRDQINEGERFDWRALFAKADEYFGGTQANGVYTPKDAYDAMELGINLYLLDSKQAYPLENSAQMARRIIEKLDTDILTLVATQTKRTAEMDEFQQFSTPPTYAYLANWVANLNSNDTYLEPSAGIGGLALFAKNAGVREVVVNELSSRRLGVLRNMPFDRYFSENAEQLNNILPAEIQPTVIVMNPPFSATAGRSQGQRDTMNGATHIEQALKRLNSGGRLVAIVGEGMAADRPAFRDWWRKIMAEYNVRANVGIEGTGYVKYGTTFDNQILVIDKTGPTSGEVVTGKVKSPSDAINLLENVRVTRPVAAQSEETNRVDQQPAGQQGGGESAETGSLTENGADAGATGSSGVDSQRGAETGGGRGGSGSNATDGNASGNERPMGGRSGKSPKSGRPDRGNASRTDGSDNAAGRSGSNEQAVESVKVGSAENADSASGEISNSVFENYSPKKVRIDGAVPHNTPLVESAALSSVVPPDPTYSPKLDKKIIKNGLLSDAQLEAVVYAGQAHEQTLPDGKTRRGFFLGDGTGVGKGRQISGVILDNWNQGRKKAIWISKKKELMVDAKRDFGDLGGDPSLFIDLGKKKIVDKVTAEQGILFAGYPTIRGSTKEARAATKANKGKRKENDEGISYERIQQIVDWVGKDFDGAIVFDEAHEMGNAVPIKGKRGNRKPSDQALAALELQRALPNARVMYVSATGATEVSNLAYAERLGIWGEGTPFSTVLNFVAEMSRSVSAMELVAQNLKQMGLYLARSLSYDGVKYERLEHTLTDYQRETYDKLAGSWQVVLQNINAALETTGVMTGGKSNGSESGKIKSSIMSAFWGAHQRFFNQIITASQMPSVIKQMEDDIAAGKSIVLQITNTNEADQTRALAKLAGQKVTDDEDVDSLEELDLTPRDQLIQLVTRAFPVVQYESYTDEDGKEGIRAVKDSAGNPILNREAIAKRDSLIEELKHYEVPDSPLQMIVDVFGAEAVAEITGRTQRVVMDKEGKRKVEKRSAANVFADSESFKDGKKKILIFSQAGGTGFSFHADRRYKNQAQRVHYVLQPGWSADKAVQGFGRSHRTNQSSAPIYRLITTDIPAQKRFISSIARRLEQLGALTAGQRDTAGGSMFSAVDNLESKYATMAVRQFFEAMKPGMGVSDMPADLLEQMGLSGLYDDNGALVEGKIPPVTQFLNRLLSLKLDAQNAAFDFFMRNMEAQIDLAKRMGAFDDGMQTIRHQGAAAQNEQVVYTDPMTGAPTKYYELQYKVENPIYKFDTANSTIAASKQGSWFKNNHSGRVAGVWTTNQVRTDKEGRIHKLYGIWRTSGTTYENADDFKPAAWTKLSVDEAKAVWESENAERPTTVPRRLHMVVGGILPIWDRFNNEHVSVVRLSLDDGRRLLGRQVMDKDVADTMNRLNVQSAAAKMSGSELIAAVIGGSTIEMSNRIKFKLVTVSGEKRVELDKGSRWFDVKDERNLREAGVINERIQYQQRYFIPSDPKAGGAVLDEIMRVMAMNPVGVVNNTAEQQDGAGNIASSGKLSAADKAIYGMAAEGKSAKEILSFIASASRNPFYRQLARLLQKTGIDPTITVGDGKNWKFNAGEGNKYAAGYNPKSNTIALFRPASSERNMLHELMHAATLKALAKGGLSAGQMKALYKHVKASGKLQGMYGMADVDEFIAEAFTNPAFQQKLKAIGAPKHAGTLKSAWNWFVRIVRGILGVQENQENALAQALDIGVNVMREDMAARKAGNVGNVGNVGNNVRYNLTEQANNQLYDLFHNDNKFNWLHKSVSTQFHKSTVDKDFKKVFDLGQKYLLDNSRIAMDAADEAPSLLQKLGSLADVLKSGAKRVDVEAIAGPVFNGTLDNVVYTDGQLRSQFNLTDKQISLYREFRNAINKSLDDLGVSEMARISKSILPAGVIEQAKMATLDDAEQILEDALLDDMRSKMAEASAERAAENETEAKKLEREALLAENTAGDIKKKAGRIHQLKAQGYAPLMRFGSYAVDAVETDPATGEENRVYFGMYETQREANSAARALRAEYPNAVVTQGPMDTESWKLFGGIDPSSLEVFANAVGAEESEIFNDFLRLTVNNRSALKRLIKREGIEGFSKDTQRVLAQFVTSNARLSAKNYYFGDMKKAVMDIPKMKGDVKNEAAKLVDYLQDPQEEAAGLRGYMFVHFLGGSIASAITNMTQPITMTAPYLAQFGGAAKAGAALAKAGALYKSGNYDPQLADAMKLAEREGITSPHEIHQLYAESMRGLGRNIAVRKGLRVWGSLFSLAESFNRHLTFIAAYNMGRDTGVADPFAFAQKAVEETQGIYNKGNRPDWARGTIGATVFTFKQFSISYIEFLSRLYKNDKKAFALAMAVMFVGAGAEGWPFAEDIEDLIDTIGQFFGFATNSKKWMRQNAKEVFGETGGEIFRKGVSGIPGMPLDISGRIGVSNLIPGTAMFKVSEKDKTRDIFEFIGPLGGFAKSAVDGFEAARKGDVQGAARLAAPLAFQNIAKGADMAHYGFYRDQSGRKVVDTDGYDAFIKGIGFQPNTVAKESAKIREMNQNINHAKVIESEIVGKWANGLFDKDPDKVQEAMAELREWNIKNPEARIAVHPSQISARLKAMHQTREQRFINSAPPEMRGQVAKELHN